MTESYDYDPSRRTFLGASLCGCAAAMVAGSAGPAAAATSVTEGDTLVHLMGQEADQPIKVSALEPMQAVLAVPKGPDGKIRRERDDHIVVVRLSEDLGDPAKGGTDGIAVYSAVCPHQGCFVTRLGTLGEAKGSMICQCHGSYYDPVTGDILGGPSPSGLPALPVKVENDHLIVAGSFTGPVGPK